MTRGNNPGDGRVVEEKNTEVVASRHDSRFPLSREAKAEALALNRFVAGPVRERSAEELAQIAELLDAAPVAPTDASRAL